MRWLRPIFIVWLAITGIPGAGELVEDAVQLALTAETLHSTGHDRSAEHGCAPTDHHCSCCTSLVAAEPFTPVGDLAPPSACDVDEWFPIGHQRAGIPPRVIRPPTA